MFKKLPNEILTLIYEYDSTYREIFSNIVLKRLKIIMVYKLFDEYYSDWDIYKAMMTMIHF